MAPNPCDAVLTTIDAFIGSTQNYSFDKNVMKFFMSDKFSDWVTSNSFKMPITIPLEGVPVTFSPESNNQSSLKKREQVREFYGESFTGEVSNVFYNVLGQQLVIDAWLQCSLARGRDLGTRKLVGVELQRNGSTVTATLRSTVQALSFKPVIQDVQCDSLPEGTRKSLIGKELTTDGLVAAVFPWDLSKDLSFALLSTAGAAVAEMVRPVGGEALLTTYKLSEYKPVPREEHSQFIDTKLQHCDPNAWGGTWKGEMALVVRPGQKVRLSNLRRPIRYGAENQHLSWPWTWQFDGVNHGGGHPHGLTAREAVRLFFDHNGGPIGYSIEADVEAKKFEPVTAKIPFNYGSGFEVFFAKDGPAPDLSVRMQDGYTFTVPVDDDTFDNAYIKFEGKSERADGAIVVRKYSVKPYATTGFRPQRARGVTPARG